MPRDRQSCGSTSATSSRISRPELNSTAIRVLHEVPEQGTAPAVVIAPPVRMCERANDSTSNTSHCVFGKSPLDDAPDWVLSSSTPGPLQMGRGVVGCRGDASGSGSSMSMLSFSRTAATNAHSAADAFVSCFTTVIQMQHSQRVCFTHLMHWISRWSPLAAMISFAYN